MNKNSQSEADERERKALKALYIMKENLEQTAKETEEIVKCADRKTFLGLRLQIG